MHRRAFLAAAATLATAATAAPILSPTNNGLTLAKARRRNGWIEINAAAFEANIKTTRALIGSSSKNGPRLCAVMKADAYGNGIALLIPSIIKLGVADVAITSNDEARVARALGYKGRLLRIRTATPEEMADGFRYQIEELIGNVEAATRLAAMWAKHSPKPLPVHLALNAGGMSRNGVELSTPYGKADAQKLLALKPLHIIGAMTHYPTEDAQDILAQLAHFEADLTWLQARGLGPVTRHTANTFATLTHPQTRLDMVRVGGALYGDPGSVPTQAFTLTQSIKSRIAAIQHFPEGQTVNYDRTFRLTRESYLANIPIGYSDGFSRRFSHANRPEYAKETTNAPQVLIRGQRFPIIGRITMNTMMVDITGHQNQLALDDEVTLFGKQGGDTITQAQFEAASAGFAPEMLAVLGATLPRVLANPSK